MADTPTRDGPIAPEQAAVESEPGLADAGPVASTTVTHEEVAPVAPAIAGHDEVTPVASTTAAQDVPGPNDVAMTDAPASGDQDPSPAPVVQAAPTTASSPAPTARTGTPNRAVNGHQDKEPSSSRANSVHPDSGFTVPAQAANHGDPTREYLNKNVTGPLLEGMKQIAKDQPRDPLRILGEFLIQRSKDLEGTA